MTFVELGDVPHGVVELHAIWNRTSKNPALHSFLTSTSTDPSLRAEGRLMLPGYQPMHHRAWTGIVRDS